MFTSLTRCPVWTALTFWCLFTTINLTVADDRVVDLDSKWSFALDPLDLGEKYGWNAVPKDWDSSDEFLPEKWDVVQVPHDFLTDPRYEWTGTAWYRKSIQVPAGGDGAVYLLQFDRVASKCDVWVNGMKAGSHRGAHTPFEFDISNFVHPGSYNHLSIRVNNRREVGDIPGPRHGARPHDQLVAWLNYGGILRSARLVVRPSVYVTNQKIVAKPNFADGSAEVSITAFICNGSSKRKSVKVNCNAMREADRSSVVDGAPPSKVVSIEANDQTKVTFHIEIVQDRVKLWSLDSPELYVSRVSVTDGEDDRESHTLRGTFGIRTIEARGTSLLLNGEPIRLAGVNRVEGHPGFGSLETAGAVELDMGLMKRAHLELHRLQHYPVSKQILNWADRHGMLIINEVPAWNLGPKELSDERFRSNSRSQFIEMVESSWNHPCVIGWSVGNEYASWTPEGVAWTKDFVSLAKQLDPTRPTTFAAVNHAPQAKAPTKQRRSMHWVDFISLNQYSSAEMVGSNLDLLHTRWPNKPILLTEFGRRADQVSEEQRIKHFRDVLEVVRNRDYVAGMSYWSFNDYRSRYPGTDKNGHRPWGIVEANRTPRTLYHTMRADLRSALIEVVQQRPLSVEIEARSDFPSMTLRGYTLRVLDGGGQTLDEEAVPVLRPGDSKVIEMHAVYGSRIQLIRPTGAVSSEIEL